MLLSGYSPTDMKDDSIPAVPRNRVISTLMSGHSSTKNEGQQFILKSEPGFAARSSQVFDSLKSLENEHKKRKDEHTPADTFQFPKIDSAADDILDTSNVFKKPQGFAPKRKKPKEESEPDLPEKKQKDSLSGEHDEESNVIETIVLSDDENETDEKTDNLSPQKADDMVTKKTDDMVTQKTNDSTTKRNDDHTTKNLVPTKTVIHFLSTGASGIASSSNAKPHVYAIESLKPDEMQGEPRKKKKTVFHICSNTVKKSSAFADTYVPKRLMPVVPLTPTVQPRPTIQKRLTFPKKRHGIQMVSHYAASTSSTSSRSQFSNQESSMEQNASAPMKGHVRPHPSSEKDRDKSK